MKYSSGMSVWVKTSKSAPGDGGAGLFPVGGGDLHLADELALFKVEVIAFAVPADDDVP